MILRPSKIFVSFHQLRHYFHVKISELVVISQKPIKPANTATQQSILYYLSDIQRSLINKSNSPALFKRNPVNDPILLRVIQKHFPMVKVFSPSATATTFYYRQQMIPFWLTAGSGQHQFRTMMSSAAANATGTTTTATTATTLGNGCGTIFMSWGFPRTTTVGLHRTGTPAFARQFSTGKSCTTTTHLFQNTTQATANNQPSVFARMFSPATGNKVSSDNTGHGIEAKQAVQPTFVPFYSHDKDPSYSDSEESDAAVESSIYQNRMFASSKNGGSSKGMGELINNNNCLGDESNSNCGSWVRRGSISSGSSVASNGIGHRNSSNSIATQQHYNKRVNNNKHAINRKKLEHIVQHDELSYPGSTRSDHGTSGHGHRIWNRKAKYSRLKHPLPDSSHHDTSNKRGHDHQQQQQKQQQCNIMTPESPCTDIDNTMDVFSTARSVYLLVMLDTFHYLDNYWATQSLDSTFIDTIETIASQHQHHIQNVTSLLDNLLMKVNSSNNDQQQFRVVVKQGELRIYFPVLPRSKQEAVEILKTINVDPDAYFLEIVVEDHTLCVTATDENTSSNNEKIKDGTADRGDIGPDYFKDLQMFLDRTDHLIETSPAFSSKSKSN